MITGPCRHTRRRVRDLIATTSRLNTRAFRMSALVCEDCGKTLITDSVQSIHQILLALETLEERISAIERASETDRDTRYRIAAWFRKAGLSARLFGWWLLTGDLWFLKSHLTFPSAYFFAKQGIPSLYSQHFYATSWDDFHQKKTDDKRLLEKLNTLQRESHRTKRYLWWLLGLQFLVSLCAWKLDYRRKVWERLQKIHMQRFLFGILL